MPWNSHCHGKSIMESYCNAIVMTCRRTHNQSSPQLCVFSQQQVVPAQQYLNSTSKMEENKHTDCKTVWITTPQSRGYVGKMWTFFNDDNVALNKMRGSH